jgi:hypothetical protein
LEAPGGKGLEALRCSRTRTATQRAKQSPSGEDISTAQRTWLSNQRRERWDGGVGLAALCLLLGMVLGRLGKEVRRVAMKPQWMSAPARESLSPWFMSELQTSTMQTNSLSSRTVSIGEPYACHLVSCTSCVAPGSIQELSASPSCAGPSAATAGKSRTSRNLCPVNILCDHCV